MPIERVPRADLFKVVHDIEEGGGYITALTSDLDDILVAWVKRPDRPGYETRIAPWMDHPSVQQVLKMRSDAAEAGREVAEALKAYTQRGDAA